MLWPKIFFGDELWELDKKEQSANLFFSEAKQRWFSISNTDKRIITDQSPAWCLCWLQGVSPQQCHHTSGCHTLAGSLPWAWAVVACPSPLWFAACTWTTVSSLLFPLAQTWSILDGFFFSSGGRAPVKGAREVTQSKQREGCHLARSRTNLGSDWG